MARGAARVAFSARVEEWIYHELQRRSEVAGHSLMVELHLVLRGLAPPVLRAEHATGDE